MVLVEYLLAKLVLISVSIVSASSNVAAPGPGDGLSVRNSPPAYVANKILWAPDDDGDHLFCKSEGSPQVGLDDPDCGISVSDCSFLGLGFQSGFLHPRGTWFQVWRQFTQSTSNLTRVARHGSCSISIALLNGSSAS